MGGKMMRQTAIPDEQPALSEKDKELLQRLIEARQNALSKPDPERYGLSEIEARLRELGWSEKE
jgi:hypothetical protein